MERPLPHHTIPYHIATTVQYLGHGKMSLYDLGVGNRHGHGHVPRDSSGTGHHRIFHVVHALATCRASIGEPREIEGEGRRRGEGRVEGRKGGVEGGEG